MELIDISPGDGSAMFDLNLFIISSHFRATLYRHLGPAQRRGLGPVASHSFFCKKRLGFEQPYIGRFIRLY